MIGILPWLIFNYSLFGVWLGPQIQQNPLTGSSRWAVIALHLVPLGQRKWALLLLLVFCLGLFLLVKRRSLSRAIPLFFIGIVVINAAQIQLYLQGAAT